MTNPIAHVRQTETGAFVTHDLSDHLFGTAALARQFAETFGSGDWAYLAGLWHDLGKYRERFQRYIRKSSGYDSDAHIEGKPGRAPHSTAGALLACDRFDKAGRVLAYLIAGHHAGLHDWHGGLDSRLDGENARRELQEALSAGPPAEILAAGDTFRPDLRRVPGLKEGFALWIRMLFSCLVDADFLDTEEFMEEDKAKRRGGYPEIPELLACFDRYMKDMAERLAEKGPLTPVNRLRTDTLRQCRERAGEPPGLFSLTVPTGGGKTLSSMAFALEHAKRHGKRRIIYAIPYTSIIEQTSDVFRRVFEGLAPDPVVEHHSNADADASEETLKSRLACENWDAPIIVTTNVQFYESLFTAKTSRCRKLHNIVNSVVVLDEAHLLPPEFLQPILDVLKLLAHHYGVSIVLSSATQPALSTREYFDPSQNLDGLDNVRELMEGGPFVRNPDELYRALKRVEVRLPEDWNTPMTWESLTGELQQRGSVLCIVNRRKDARELFKLMPKGTLHLSALMCGAHRSDVIRLIKKRLEAGEIVRVVSTQLVEAGVDLDFPVVYRALAGLDSIAQAAGRCNREGKLEKGEVVVFIPPKASPPGLLRKAEDASRTVLYGKIADPLERTLFDRYFVQFYHACQLDQHGIRDQLKVGDNSLAVNFRTAAEKFRLIQDQDSATIVVRYRGLDQSDNTVNALLGKLRKDGPERWLMRKLQRYTVSVPRRYVERWLRLGDVQEWQPGLFVQVSDVGYSNDLGLLLEEDDGEPPVLCV
ncbi:CRISPR-associated helicase/endonuclease Cas3 [Methylocaldum szegediense]|uniref:CRISPR-associated endonuclease/helicase Cas3 n=1 Tax=Methylocaldum szegediense TaxID=73780 RepID=A0ABN8XAF1_9GAMM|nr:CRISPR-associated helicase/endonuclease Cas3 [Methylocaldum szegediense]CAI8970425.1 CRISPR-associated endonuclease/helicase Cas3 [Methylocaldum szegediense]